MPRPVIVLPRSLEAIRDYPLLGERLETEQGAAQVEQLIETAMLEHPTHGLPHAARAWLLARRKEIVDALEEINQALELGPETMAPQWFLDRGVYNSLLGHWKPAIVDMTTCCRLWPDDANGHLIRSMEFKKMGDGLSGALEEQLAIHLNSQTTLDDLCEFIHNYGFYATPERLEASLMVMCDPLNPKARAHRAELMLTLGVPTAAYHDYQVAAELDRRNLGTLARIEEIRQQGLLVDPPLIAPEKPTIEIWPVYQQVLDHCKNSFEAIKHFEAGEKPSWAERVFGRVSSKLKYQNNRVAWNFILYGMLISSVAITLNNTLDGMVAFVGLVRFPAAYKMPENFREILVVANLLARLFGFCTIYGSYLSTKGAFRLIFKSRDRITKEGPEVLVYLLCILFFVLFFFISTIPINIMLELSSLYYTR